MSTLIIGRVYIMTIWLFAHAMHVEIPENITGVCPSRNASHMIRIGVNVMRKRLELSCQDSDVEGLMTI